MHIVKELVEAFIISLFVFILVLLLTFSFSVFCIFAVSKIKTYDIKIEKRVEKDKPIKE